jgi:hypothetical protein
VKNSVPGGYKYGELAFHIGEVSNEAVKYSLECRGTHTGAGLRWRRTAITDPSSRQRWRYKITNLQLSKEYFKEKEKLVAGPRRVPDTKTD